MPRVSIIILALSTVINAVFGVVLYQRLSVRPTADLRDNGSTAPQPTATASAPLSDAARWQKISDATDDAGFVTQLRSAGFPPHVVRALVGERIEARYATRLRALRRQSPGKPYWQANGWYNSDLDLASRNEQRAINREIADTVMALLGDDPAAVSPTLRAYRARTYGNLPPAKVMAIEAINRDYREIAANVHAETQGIVLSTDREKLILIENERRADLTRLLTPEELVEHDIRNSPAALEIRSKFRYFDATEPEFLALYQLQRDFDARYGRDNLSGEQNDRRKEALPELTRQMETALGSERFANFEILTDGNYPATRGSMTELGLPPESAAELVRVQRSTTRRADAIRSDKTLTSDQRSLQLAALAKEATAQTMSTLGSAENLSSYKRNTAGQWLTRLAPLEKSAANP